MGRMRICGGGLGRKEDADGKPWGGRGRGDEGVGHTAAEEEEVDELERAGGRASRRRVNDNPPPQSKTRPFIGASLP